MVAGVTITAWTAHSSSTTFLHDRSILAALPTLPEVSKQCPVKGHCSTAMQLIQECSSVDVCSEAVAILKLPLVSPHRLEDSWLPHPAAHTSTKRGLARERKQKGLPLRQGTQPPAQSTEPSGGLSTLLCLQHRGISDKGGLARHANSAPAAPSARLHTKPALTREKDWNSSPAHLSGPAPEGQEQ